MKRLAPPTIDANDVYVTCASGIGLAPFKGKVDAGLPEFNIIANDYTGKSAAGDLFQIPHIPNVKGVDPTVFADLTKKDLIKMYEYYMVGKHPGRAIYDTILLAANEKCPYCGGIGRPRTLDHYLPKSSFPQFAIHPLNLCPSCRDCNDEGKGTSFAQQAEDQIIHPYVDPDHFFNDQWVFADVIEDDPCSLRFYSMPPDHWTTVDIARASKHFEVFDLGVRYAIQAGEELSSVIDARREFMAELTSDSFSEDLVQRSLSPALFANHWKRVMYQSLSQNEWFCSSQF